jgi:hypothetical protein
MNITANDYWARHVNDIFLGRKNVESQFKQANKIFLTKFSCKLENDGTEKQDTFIF